jgi:hypothetical protein
VLPPEVLDVRDLLSPKIIRTVFTGRQSASRFQENVGVRELGPGLRLAAILPPSSITRAERVEENG